jgi:2-polyprenyl-6-hydroxyphenyl methylase/3-demethylubiquinone-9 3-methyltransferase
MFAIVGAEHILRLLPAGTHEYDKFIKPSELAGWIRDAGLVLEDMTGLTYNPITRTYRLNPRDVSVNYMVHTVKPA